MKILVIDDNPLHQKSAHQIFDADHDLVVLGDHDSALDGINTWDNEYLNNPKEVYWDVVLSDLLMRPSTRAQSREGMHYTREEMPVGWSLAILAAIYGAKYVAVVTDMNHHHHPASAMLDHMYENIFTISNAKAIFTNHVRRVGIEVSIDGECVECSGAGETVWAKGFAHESTDRCRACYGTGHRYTEHGKDWGAVLNTLLSSKDSL